MSSKQSIGEYRVGIGFNPSGDPDVHALKVKAAAFIDHCDALKNTIPSGRSQAHGEIFQLLERAMRECESAAMWAVKGATKRHRE